MKLLKYFTAISLFLVGPSLVGQGVAALELTGAFSQGGLLVGQVSPGSSVTLMDRSISVEEDGSFVFGLVYLRKQ